MRPGSQNFAVRVSRRVYRWLLRAYPRDHRLEWADAMEQLFRDCARDEFSRAGYLGLAFLWLRTLRDFAASVFREYRRRPRRFAPPFAAVATNPLYNFTPRAQQALALARKEADRLGHNFVGTEHVLLGILAHGQNVGVAVLKNLSVDASRLRAAIEQRLNPGADENKGRRHKPFTPRVKKALTLAGKTATALGHGYLGCEHMLVGLALTEDGLAKTVLEEFGVSAVRCRAEIGKVLAEKAAQAEGDSPARFRPRHAFEGEGRCIRQNARENIHGHVRLRLILVGRRESPPALRVTFDITEKNLPDDQWAVIQRAIQEWWRENPSTFGSWLAAVEIFDGSWCEGATPAFDRAAVAALKDAVGKAVAAGWLSGM
ncbi:MAG TPA: Clp protease N-terminal domain-containing protein [Opitutaceae bacterium]|nr:Clp protease N-terminal domain-containing protein [Opitutaceae bacterium]